MKAFFAVCVVLACVAISAATSISQDNESKHLFKCPGEGNFPVEDNCRSFVQCKKILGLLVPFPGKCAPLRVFNAKAEKCQFGLKCLPNGNESGEDSDSGSGSSSSSESNESVAPGEPSSEEASNEDSVEEPQPTEAPTEAPVESEESQETDAPTEEPDTTTETPTEAPTDAPTEAPTDAPTDAPTEEPTTTTTQAPTEEPTEAPTTTTTTEATEVPEPNFCVAEGFFPNPEACDKFIRCVDYGVGYGILRFDFDCAPGTDLWCQELLTCAFDFQCPSKCLPGGVRQ